MVQASSFLARGVTLRGAKMPQLGSQDTWALLGRTQTVADGEQPLQHSSVPEVLTFFCFNLFFSFSMLCQALLYTLQLIYKAISPLFRNTSYFLLPSPVSHSLFLLSLPRLTLLSLFIFSFLLKYLLSPLLMD